MKLYRIRITNGTASYLYKGGKTYRKVMEVSIEAATLFSNMRTKGIYTFDALVEPAPDPRCVAKYELEKHYNGTWPVYKQAWKVYDNVDKRYLSKEEIQQLKETITQ